MLLSPESGQVIRSGSRICSITMAMLVLGGHGIIEVELGGGVSTGAAVDFGAHQFAGGEPRVPVQPAGGDGFGGQSRSFPGEIREDDLRHVLSEGAVAIDEAAGGGPDQR